MQTNPKRDSQVRTGSVDRANAKRDSKVSFGTQSSRSPKGNGPFEMAPETAQSRVEILDYGNNTDILAASLPRYASEENFE